MLMGMDSPMAATLRPSRETTFFFGGGGPKKRVMKRIDLDAANDDNEEEAAAGFQAWLPDGYSRGFKIVCDWPFGLLDYGSATLRCKI